MNRVTCKSTKLSSFGSVKNIASKGSTKNSITISEEPFTPNRKRLSATLDQSLNGTASLTAGTGDTVLILIAEPHSDICYLIQELIRRKIAGCEIKTASHSPDIALSIEQESLAGIVIGGFNAPVALELALLVKSRYPNAFVVLFSPKYGAQTPPAPPWSAIVPQHDFPRLIAQIEELVGQAEKVTSSS